MYPTLQHVSLHCSMYPYIAACIPTLQHVSYIAACIPTLQHVSLHCSMYPYIAACIPTLQHVSLHCSMYPYIVEHVPDSWSIYIFLCKWVYAYTAGHDILLHRRPCPYIVGHIGLIPWGDKIRENRSRSVDIGRWV